MVTPLHLEILQTIAEAQSEYGDLDLRLEGGTALAAYHLKHRRSEDLDFFAHREMDARDFSAFVAECFHRRGRSVRSLRANRGFAELLIADEEEGQDPIRVQFGRTSPFELAPPDRTPERILVASYRDLCAGKLHAVDRYEPKDFIDLHMILRRPRGAPSFLDLLADLERTDPGLGPAQVGEALARGLGHDVIGQFPLRLLVPISSEEVQETIRVAMAECARIARERAGWSAG